MTDYLIKVNLALALFYIVYRICFGRDTLFGARRAALCGMALFALAYPFFEIPLPGVAGLDIPFLTGTGPQLPTQQ